MSDTDTLATQNTDTKEVQTPAKIGKVQRVDVAFPQDNPTNNNVEGKAGTDAGNNKDASEGANATLGANKGGVVDDKSTPPAPTFTNEQLKEYFKSVGIEFDSVDKLKEKLTPPAPEPTDEQKAEKAKAQEKRRLDLFINGGGTAEQYVAIKNIAEGELSKLSFDTTKTELLKAGFTDDEANKIIKDRYFQYDDADLTDDELEEEEEKREKAFKKRLKEYGANKLANRASHTKKQAETILQGLNEAIESEDLQAQNELSFSSNIDEQFKQLSRKDTYEIGEINGKPISPIESQVPESELATVHAMLKDPAQRQQFLYNEDGSLNTTNIVNVLAENVKLKAAMKTSYHEGATRTNAAWEKMFGTRTPQELGVGGNAQRPANGQEKQTPVKVGKVTRVTPTPQR